MTRSGPPGSELEIVEDEAEEIVPPEAEGMAAVVLFCATLVLIALAPFATRPQPADKAWYLAPINWPLFSLGMAAIAGAVIAWRFLRARHAAPDARMFRANAFSAFGGLAFALEYSLYFCAYLFAVSWIGFGLATLAFLQFVVWRAGLRGRRWIVATFLLTVTIVVIFRLGIGLWFPLAPLFKLFPAWVGNFFGSVL